MSPPDAPATGERPAAIRDRMLEVSALFREYAGLVERILHRAGVPPRDVPDARQEVFLVAYRKLPEFEARCRVSTWLCGIALRVASDFRRKAHHRRECMQPPPSERDGCSGFDRSDAAEQRDQLAHALDALAQVAAPQREVFVLFELFELPMNEVAARVGCPLKTAFSRLYAARRQLDLELRKRGLLAGIGSEFFPFGDRLLPRAAMPTAAASSAGTAPWLALAVAAAALSLMAKSPAAEQVASVARVSPAPPVSRASVAAPAIEARPELSVAPRTARSRLARGHTRRPAPRATRASAVSSAAPPTAAIEVTLEPADELLVIRTGAHVEAPAGDHPWAERFAPALRATRLQLRGPEDPADAIERALGP